MTLMLKPVITCLFSVAFKLATLSYTSVFLMASEVKDFPVTPIG